MPQVFTLSGPDPEHPQILVLGAWPMQTALWDVSKRDGVFTGAVSPGCLVV